MNTNNILEKTSTETNTDLINLEDSNIRTLLIKPISTIDDIVKAYEEYNLLKSRLLQQTDYQLIKWKRYIKKSWFRKLSTAFWISTQVVRENRLNIDDYFIYEITVRAISMSWRYCEACSSCASNERAFNHVENDVRAIAQTRATNRAIADLIGSWEVSAEEMSVEFDNNTNESSVNLDYNSTRSNRSTLLKNEISVKDDYEIGEIDYGNLETEDKPKPLAYVHKDNTSYWNDELITSKQKLLLIKLIENKYNDEKTRSSLITQLEFLTKKEASSEIKKMIEV